MSLAPPSPRGILQRKAKEKELVAQREAIETAGPTDPVNIALAAAAAGTLAASRPALGAFKEAVTKPKGTIAVIAEYRKKAGVSAFIDDIPEPAIILPMFREAQVSALSVLVDVKGGCTYADVDEVVRHEANSKGSFPGPAPVVWHDTVIDELQLAQAAAAGASAVVLMPSVLGGEACVALGDRARDAYALEVVLLAKTAAELEGPAAAAASVVLLSGLSEEALIEILPLVPEGPVACAALVALDDKGLEEAESAWRLRDAGFGAVWASELLYKFGMFSGTWNTGVSDNCRSVIIALRSKGSAQFGRASTAFAGKGEGAKEYLGDILM